MTVSLGYGEKSSDEKKENDNVNDKDDVTKGSNSTK